MNTDEKIELAKRILNAFKQFECFVFERNEYNNVKSLLDEIGLTRLVYIGLADPRYREIYIVLPWRLEFEQECQSRIQRLYAERKISEENYKKNRLLMITQCIKHFERERTREIINILEKYIKR
ncbi:MAG: hypothetical protein QXX35_00720 [Desulfurococcaceae archaeon]|uniref:Uncharacterized protein n=1 Tax=Staphylothermus marinus TaxID=2280 RepID=A0A7C4H9X6_STAMA